MCITTACENATTKANAIRTTSSVLRRGSYNTASVTMLLPRELSGRSTPVGSRPALYCNPRVGLRRRFRRSSRTGLQPTVFSLVFRLLPRSAQDPLD